MFGQSTFADDERFDELKKAAGPLVRFLQRYYDPMTVAVVDISHAEIYRADMGMPLSAADHPVGQVPDEPAEKCTL